MTKNNNQQQASFSNNGKVSIRQMKRMLFLELLGFTVLILPGPLAKLCQTDGVFAIFLAAGIWGMFLKSRKNASVQTAAEQGIAAWMDTVKNILQIILFAAAGGFLMYLLVSITERQLLNSGYLWIIILTILIAGGYGIMKGIESRARIYEILFWILLIPLALILIIGLWNVNLDYLLPVFASSPPRFLLGVAASLAGFLPAALSLLLQPSCTEPDRVPREAAKTVWSAGVVCAGIYLLLTGVFQSGLLSVLKYPILSLMSVVEMPGNLLERLDAPMMIIWFFCLFALFHSLCFYGIEGIQKLFPKQKNRGRKVVIGMILILTSALLLLLHGCGKKDPESNIYPLAVGIEYEKEHQELKVAYAYPAAAGSQSNANQDNNSPGKEGAGKSQDSSQGPGYKIIKAESLFQAQEQLEVTSDQMVDLNHMKVFVVNRTFLQDEKQQEELFSYFLENESMAWNTCIVFTEEPLEDLFGKDYSQGKTMGLYLEDLLKNRDDLKDKSVFTVKDFMSQCKNKNETMLVPLVALKEETVVIDHYCILTRGKDRGTLTDKESAYVRMLLNQQKTLPFLLENDAYVTLQDMHLEREITLDQNQVPRQKIFLKANIKVSADWIYTSERKEEILSQAREKLEWELTELIAAVQKEKHADLTNSFLALSGYNRQLWKLYQDNPEAYEKKLETTVEVKLKLLNT